MRRLDGILLRREKEGKGICSGNGMEWIERRVGARLNEKQTPVDHTKTAVRVDSPR